MQAKTENMYDANDFKTWLTDKIRSLNFRLYQSKRKNPETFNQQMKVHDKVRGWLALLKINSMCNHSLKKYLLSVSCIPDKV